ncbi:MAG: ubiquinol-cytochrome c reductase iron-sulfur subunit [Planctomycetes bacterium]|nr:ubiquinol-cytochrome c reductase iron-sulfur subunit [Planctomycetota bacterium]
MTGTSQPPQGGDTQGPAEGPTRRELVDYMLGGAFVLTGAATLYPALNYLVPPESGEAETSSVVLPFSAEELQPDSGRIFKFGNQPGIALKTPQGEIRAFDARCSHLSCIVQYASEQHRIMCACHMGWYDLTGRNVAGPPPRPLTAFTVNLRKRKGSDGTEIVVSRA